MLICKKCEQPRNEDDFYMRHSGPRAGKRYEKCKDCMKKRGRDYYFSRCLTERPKMYRRMHSRQVRMRALVILAKSRPCHDCKVEYDPCLMEFDHRNPKEKLTEVGSLILHGSCSINKLRVEISKCDVVCPTCHRRRTFAAFSRKGLDEALEYLANHRSELALLLEAGEIPRTGRGRQTKHGTVARYNYYGCRCQPCRDANAAKRRRDRSKAKLDFG